MTLVVFDIDGTLTNTKAIDDYCFIKSIKECWNCDLGDVDWSTFVHVTDTGLAQDIYKSKFNKEIRESEILKLKNIFYSKLLYESQVNPSAFFEVKGAEAFIKNLENDNIKIAIATGGWTLTAEHKLSLINLKLSKFPYATSDDHYSRKEIIIKSINNAERANSLVFDNIIYIGDGVWDYHATCEIGIDFIGIDINGDGKLKNLGVSSVFSDFTDSNLILSRIMNKYSS